MNVLVGVKKQELHIAQLKVHFYNLAIIFNGLLTCLVVDEYIARCEQN
jgi:hypothetical protein